MLFLMKSNTAYGHFFSLWWVTRKFKPFKARIKWLFISRETKEPDIERLSSLNVCSTPHRASWEYHSKAGDAGSSLFLSALNLLDRTVSPEEQLR